MRIMLVLAAALVIGACSALPSPPPPTPGNMDDVIAALVRRNVTVHGLISGDSGCPAEDLHDNAVHLEVAVEAQSALKHIYLFRWRKPADFEASRDAFARCVTEFSQGINPVVEISELELAPWRAYGVWDPQLARLVEEAIRSTGGTEPPATDD